MDQEEYEWYAATIQYWGKEKAPKFHRVLASRVFSGTEAIR